MGEGCLPSTCWLTDGVKESGGSGGRVAGAAALLMVNIVLVLLSGCTSSTAAPSEMTIRTPTRMQTQWERTASIRHGGTTVAHVPSPDLAWTLTMSREKGRVCWAPQITEGPSVLLGLNDPSGPGEYCTEILDGSASPVQTGFAQGAETMFAEQDHAQILTGLVDDRLTSLVVHTRRGKPLPVAISPDGSFVVQLPLDAPIDRLVFSGEKLIVRCEGGPADEITGSSCERSYK